MSDALGMTWWNRLTAAERRHWLDAAGSARPVDAWRAFQRGAPAATDPNRRSARPAARCAPFGGKP